MRNVQSHSGRVANVTYGNFTQHISHPFQIWKHALRPGDIWIKCRWSDNYSLLHEENGNWKIVNPNNINLHI